MRDLLEIFVTERTENHARITLTPRVGSAMTAIAGSIRGPFSEFSKTLTAESVVKPGAVEGTFDALIVEPCYWTPLLPFWYELRLTVTCHEGTGSEEAIPIGIKRFYCQGQNFFLEGKRIVLRGIQIASPNYEDLIHARKHETALIVKCPTEEFFNYADRLGVPLIVDLRGESLAASSLLSWHPAVMLVLISANQARVFQRQHSHLAVCINANECESAISCDAYVSELRPGERPPAWAATCDKPVIVIRKDPEAEIRTARASCDKLQAELAPEFDLAGYFV
jgi:hypothetical protein